MCNCIDALEAENARLAGAIFRIAEKLGIVQPLASGERRVITAESMGLIAEEAALTVRERADDFADQASMHQAAINVLTYELEDAEERVEELQSMLMDAEGGERALHDVVVSLLATVGSELRPVRDFDEGVA